MSENTCVHGCELGGGCGFCLKNGYPTGQVAVSNVHEFATRLDPYAVTIGGVRADPYRIARAYGIADPVLFQALKKLLRSGRKHKTTAQDIREAITSLERWEEMNREDNPT